MASRNKLQSIYTEAVNLKEDYADSIDIQINQQHRIREDYPLQFIDIRTEMHYITI